MSSSLERPETALMKSLLALCRVSNLPTVWMNVLSAAVLAAQATGAPTDPAMVIALAMSMSAFYCGGMSLNDLCDRHWDAVHQPFRPIPTGRISVARASSVTVMLFLSGFALLMVAPHSAALGAASVLLGVIALYDRFHKAYRASILLMAAARLMVFVVTAMAVGGKVANTVWLAGGLQFGYTLFVTVVARYEHHFSRSLALVPRLIAGMSVLDGCVLALLVAPEWLAAGLAAALLVRVGHRFVRGD
jgi:4-hydroxybenzoate polyprenyltransferase